jgi:hypothetical protein
MEICRVAANVRGFAVGGAILLRRPGRRVMSCDTEDKNLIKSLLDKCRPAQMLNRITGDDRPFVSPPAAGNLHVVRCFSRQCVNGQLSLPILQVFSCLRRLGLVSQQT